MKTHTDTTLQHGKVKTRCDVAAVQGRVVTLSDGEVAEYDQVVCCTGYDVKFPFLDDGVVDASVQCNGDSQPLGHSGAA